MRTRNRFFVNCYHMPEEESQKAMIEALASNTDSKKLKALAYSERKRERLEFVEVTDEMGQHLMPPVVVPILGGAQ